MEAESAPILEERSVSRKGSGVFGGVSIEYTVTAATHVLAGDQDRKPVFFHVSYIRDDSDPSQRPISFAFNGGPGSSTVWLHLGVLGPKRLVTDEMGLPTGRVGRLEENVHSILDVTDLVHVDAVGTGLSTADPKEEEKGFHHFTRDVQAFADFIVDYLNRSGRWSSPKFLIGESYGTVRGAALAAALFERHNVELDGLILVSPVLNLQTIDQERDSRLFHPGNDLPFLAFLPTYTATAWYHGRLPKKIQAMSLEEAVTEAEEFAIGAYWSGLARGDRLGARERSRLVSRLSDLTGLTEGYVDRYDLRIHIYRFCKELLRDRRRTVGRLDSRFIGIDRVHDGDTLESDPSWDRIAGAFTSAVNDYLRAEIGFETRDFYDTSSMEVFEAWDYEDFKGRYVDVSESLRAVMSRSPGLRVFTASGYYDLATPHFGLEYTLSHMGLDPSLRDNVESARYQAGHMMYLHRPSLALFTADLRRFIAGGVARPL